MALMLSNFNAKCFLCKGDIAKGSLFFHNRNGARGEHSAHQPCWEEYQGRPKATPDPEQSEQSEPQQAAPTAYERDDGVLTYRDASGAKVWVRHYDSITAFTDSCKTIHRKNAALAAEMFTRHEGHKSLDWYGVGGGHQGARDTINAGWVDGLRRAEDNLDMLNVPPIAGIKRRVVRADHGDELDIHRTYRGDFDNAWSKKAKRMSAFGRAQKTMIVNISALYDVTAEELFWRGAAAVKVADALTGAGYQLEITGIISNHNQTDSGSNSTITTFVIKQSGAPLDKLELAGVVCLAGFFRVYGFLGRMSLPITIRSNLGYTNNNVPEQYAGDDIIKGLEDVNSQASAQKWVNDTINDLGLDELEKAA